MFARRTRIMSRMGDIVPPTGSGIPQRYKIIASGKSLKVSIYETNTAHTIFIGGHHKFCIDCLIVKGSDTAFLAHIYSNVECSLEKNFLGGHNAKMILHLLLSFLKKHFPHITSVEFNDTSNKTCDNKHIVELYEMSYIHTGKTWYENNFEARLQQSDEIKFKKEEENFQRRKGTWDDFKTYLRGELPLDELIMKNMFDNSSSWQQFFSELVEQIKIAPFCEFIAPWLHTFMVKNMRFSFTFATYYIQLSDYSPISFEESIFRGGNRRYTAKRFQLRGNGL